MKKTSLSNKRTRSSAPLIIRSVSPAETQAVGYAFGEMLCSYAPRNDAVPLVIFLRGDLGAGKTTFVQAAAKALAARGKVKSPTFIIARTHRIMADHYDSLTHIDAYRLSAGDRPLGEFFHALLSRPRSIIFIEWPDAVQPHLSRMNCITITFRIIGESERRITMRASA